mgnify:CR=1 FL=1
MATDAGFSLAMPRTASGDVGDAEITLTGLARGRYFWRVYGDCGTAGRSPVSYTWSFWVSGASTTGRPIGWTPDLDGDGLGDIVAGSPSVTDASGPGTVSVYLSNMSALLSTRRTAVITGTSPGFGASVAVVPDMTGDGLAELAVGSCSRNNTIPCATEVNVYRVLPTPGVLAPATALIAHFTADHGLRFGADLAGVGDLDGDGYGELLVASPGEFGATPGSFQIVRGGVGIFPPGTAISAPSDGSPDPVRFAWSIAGVGDVTGDGLVDALVTGLDRAWVYPGRSATSPAFTTPIPLSLAASGDGDMGFVASPGGDLNGDGTADFAIGRPGYGGGFGSVSIFHGGGITDRQVPTQTIVGIIASGRFGAAVAGGGDVAGGGTVAADELLVGAPGAAAGGGFVYVVSRMVGGAYAEAPQSLPMVPAPSIGRAVAILGDFNGDGFDDFVASAGGTVMTTSASAIGLWRGNGTAAPTLGDNAIQTGTPNFGYTLGER